MPKILELVPPPKQTHAEALELLKAFIKDIGERDFTAIAVVGVTRGGPVVMRYMTDPKNWSGLIAAIARLQREVLAADDETDVKDLAP